MPQSLKNHTIARAWRPAALSSFLAISLSFLAACGGGGGGSGPTPPPGSPLPGIWFGAFHPGTDVSRPGYLVVLPDQSFRSLDSLGQSEVTGNLSLARTQQVGGAGTWYQGRLGVTPAVAVTFSGTFNPSPTPTLEFGFELADSGFDCSMTPDGQATIADPHALAGIFTAPRALSALGFAETLTIPDGGQTFSGTATDASGAAQGTYSGTLLPIASLNAFTVEGAFTPAGGGAALPLTGVMYLRVGSAATNLVFIADNAPTGGTRVFGGIYTRNP